MTRESEVLRAIRAQAACQDGVVTSTQLQTAGTEPAYLRRIVRAGRWVPLARGSYWVTVAPDGPSLRTRVRAVMLSYGSRVVAVHETAARLYGIEGLPKDDGILQLAVLTGHSMRGRPGVAISRLDLPPEAYHVVNGIRLTTPARTCADLLWRMDRPHAVSMLDSALHKGVLGPGDRSAVAAQLWNRPNAEQARSWLDLADPRAESPLETRVRLACLDDGLPSPVLQWRIPDPHQRSDWRIDLGWPAQLVGLEADGREEHDKPEALHRDRFRQNRLVTLVPGLTLLRVTWADTYAPGPFLSRLREALGRR
ncbi:type IV toxin-antitoxin system AbiEi family antitoxin domain-containing protein [Actinacidiphila oryziradicis]|uniref:Type IV toxin-antitoxin system AbiEi family antitoxin domain-containing protein n=1 Tax=Actinacidiphila oryziradicis TaxID=2571141 RepID=A0A4U0SFY3_9ACTN|nr:type IV toxin-antitoxin system AbiEi family antitoxin domain-containing protein [Actinacidiphila oryziradicis]TKA08386.1 hypothetical protein FCI23_28255 [Actinacidiphila oryziradicis]